MVTWVCLCMIKHVATKKLMLFPQEDLVAMTYSIIAFSRINISWP